MNIKEVAHALEVSVQRVQQLIASKKIKATNVGHGAIIPRWDIALTDLMSYRKRKTAYLKAQEDYINAEQSGDDDELLMASAHLAFEEMVSEEVEE